MVFRPSLCPWRQRSHTRTGFRRSIFRSPRRAFEHGLQQMMPLEVPQHKRNQSEPHVPCDAQCGFGDVPHAAMVPAFGHGERGVANLAACRGAIRDPHRRKVGDDGVFVNTTRSASLNHAFVQRRQPFCLGLSRVSASKEGPGDNRHRQPSKAVRVSNHTQPHALVAGQYFECVHRRMAELRGLLVDIFDGTFLEVHSTMEFVATTHKQAHMR